MKLGYLQLFQGVNETLLESIWNEPGAPEALARLATNSNAPDLARFLAAEILFHKQDTYPPEEQKKQLASVYATALAENFTGAANAWGLPDILEGSTGEHLILLGDASVPPLKKLLQDDQRVYYEGSEEATLGNDYGYRVKDLAAFYLSRIRDIPFEMHENPRKRDKTIEKLEKSL